MTRESHHLHMADGGLALPSMEMYYLASHLQHAAHWLSAGDNWEKKLLADEAELPQFHHSGGTSDTAVQYTIKHTASLWERAMRVALGRAPFAREFNYLDLPFFRLLTTTVDGSAWREGGYLTLGDLDPYETFITFEAAHETFGVGRG